MQDFLLQAGSNFKEFFKSLDTNRKIGLIGTTVILVSLMSALIIWAAKTQYKLLYTDLSKEDAASISQMLEDGKITYQVKDDGKSLYVPEDQVEKWRLEIAKKGVSLTSTLGYEVFDKQAFGTTSFVQKINKQRAIEGELMKTIKHIKGVARARVHLSIPESSPFISEKKAPSASVVLDLKSGFSLAKEEIKGIQALISGSVDGMRVQDVVIIDSKGGRLTENSGDSMAQHTASRLALESKVNRKYESQIESILRRVVGDGKVIAKVNVKMDFTESIQESTNYDSENSAVVSEVANKQKYQGVRPSPQGIPGARSNVPGEKPQPGIPETRNDTDKSLTTRNFNVPKTVTKSKKPTADIQSLSVAVMIDGKRVNRMGDDGQVILDDEGLPVKDYQPWSDAEIANFQAIVTSAVGIDAKRGDSIVIKNMEFAKEDLSAAEALLRQRENREIIRNLTKYLMIGVLITLFFFVIVRPFIQWVTENTSESIEDYLPKTIEELERIQVDSQLPGLEDALPSLEDRLNPEKIEGNMLREKIISMIDADPSKAAQVVSDMVHSGEAKELG